MKPNSKNNNINFIRACAAFGVLVAHTLPIKYGSSDLLILGLFRSGYLGFYSVLAFFFISGYLITQSFQYAKSVASFFEARMLRIYPELLASALFCLLIVGPLTTTYGLKDYFFIPQILNYLKATFLVGSDNLPGVFATGSHFQGAVNGSLWSLIHEVRLYILVGVLGFLGLLSPPRLRAITLVAVLVLIPLRYGVFSLDSLDQARKDMCLLYAAFTLGGLFFHFNEKIIFSWLVVATSWALYYFIRSEYLFLASFCYTIYYACFCSKVYVAKLNFKNDLSYGIYVFAWPTQQTIIYFYPQIDTAFFLILSSAFTLILAYCSWHYVGKPALTLKNKTLLSGLRFEKYRNWILLKAWPRG